MIATMISMYLDLMKFGVILTYDITTYFFSMPISAVQFFIQSWMPPIVPKTLSAIDKELQLKAQVDFYHTRMVNIMENLESVAKNTTVNIENITTEDVREKIAHYQGMLKNIVNNLEALTQTTTANLEANSLTVNQLIVGKDKDKDS